MKRLAVFVALGASAAVAQTAPQAPPPGCTAAEHRQFDFWVGEWTVYPTGAQQAVATSLIERVHGGCVIRENWRPAKGASGTSLNMYDAIDRKWRQTWADASGSWVEFAGGVEGEAMVLTGNWRSAAPGKSALTRMTYTRQPAGAVRQLGEQTTDGGKTWTKSFDFTYRPLTATATAKP